jgi:hypothetical protein
MKGVGGAIFAAIRTPADPTEALAYWQSTVLPSKAFARTRLLRPPVPSTIRRFI